MKHYIDFYGASASIRTHRDGTATLSVSCAGRRVHRKTYSSERGAKVATGKIGDCWREKK